MKQQTQTNKIEWREVELKEICKVAGGFAFKSSEFVDGGIPIVRISNFNNNNVNLSEAVYYPIDSDKKYKDYLLSDEDILIAMSGATTGKIGTINKKNLPALLNQRVGKFIINDKNQISRDFILFFVKSKIFFNFVCKKAFGCAQPNISSRDIESIKIPLPFLSNNKPDLKEQERIVKILEKAEKVKERGDNAEKLLDEYLKNVFNEMFSNQVSKKNEWKIDMLGNQSIIITKGETPIGKGDNYVETGILFVRSENVLSGRLDLTKKTFISPEVHKRMKRSQLKKNDVLINIVGASIGRVAIFGEDCEANINQAIALIRLKKDLNPLYVLSYLNSPFAKARYEDLQKGVARDNLSLTQMRDFKIPLPPLPLQQKFAKIVEQVEKMKENVKKTKGNSEELFNSLMQKAFRGEL